MPRPFVPPVLRANLVLKMAIWTSGYSQQNVARLALIEPQKLSHAIYGRRELMPLEQKRLARVLQTTVETIFPANVPTITKKTLDDAPSPYRS